MRDKLEKLIQAYEELEKRLRGRGTEDEETISTRLANAAYEMGLMDAYDATIVNDDLDRATDELHALIESYETDGGSTCDVCDET